MMSAEVSFRDTDDGERGVGEIEFELYQFGHEPTCIPEHVRWRSTYWAAVKWQMSEVRSGCRAEAKGLGDEAR